MSRAAHFITLCLLALGGLSANAEEEIRQASVKGLLFIELEGDDLGTASTLNATILPQKPGNSFVLAYNQKVGPLMEGALDELSKFLYARHGDDLPDMRMEFSFADRHSPKDGPSACVATALLAESILSNTKVLSDIAVTGDMSAVGEIQPVGGVVEKLKAAALAKCQLALVPHRNRRAIQDFTFLYGVKGLARLPVLSVENFEEAFSLAKAERSTEIEEALANYDGLAAQLVSGKAKLREANSIAKLREVTAALPNHLSAQMLLAFAERRAPKHLSLGGSLQLIDDAVDSMLASLQGNGANQKKRFSEKVAALNRVKKKIDPRTTKYLNSFLAASRYIQRHYDRARVPDSVRAEMRKLIKQIDIEATKLGSDPEVIRELEGE